MNGEQEFEKLKIQVDKVSDSVIWDLYAYLQFKLKERKLVRTRNVTGERGEFLALKFYNETNGLPKLQVAPEGTKNVDALSRKGERYSIKTISGKTVNTGTFTGLGEKKEIEPEKKFEYLIIVILNKDLQPDQILELTWEQFLKLKYWNSGMRGWGLTVNKKLIKEAKLIYESSRPQIYKTWRKHLYV